jgi:hypothetical protein
MSSISLYVEIRRNHFFSNRWIKTAPSLTWPDVHISKISQCRYIPHCPLYTKIPSHWTPILASFSPKLNLKYNIDPIQALTTGPGSARPATRSPPSTLPAPTTSGSTTWCLFHESPFRPKTLRTNCQLQIMGKFPPTRTIYVNLSVCYRQQSCILRYLKDILT